jgi:superfamily II DNA or RNA helicase
MLSPAERLQLQQLRLLAWAESRSDPGADEVEEPSLDDASGSPPARWELTQDVVLHPWQEAARDAWFGANGRGTIKVVTGAGKTMLALAIAERLQHRDPELRVAVVVPTIVLLNQWHQVLTQQSNLPPRSVGRLGGGHSDAFTDETRILIAVLATARKELPARVRRAGVGDHLLLVADECHRTGAPEMSAVLSTERAYSLGLSATPERDDSDDVSASYAKPGREDMGPIVYEMTFADAISSGILPPFEVHHFGLQLTPDEERRYSTLTTSITDLRRELMAASPTARRAGGGEGLLAWARRASARGDGGLGSAAARYVNDTRRRKHLLYTAEARKTATVALVRDALSKRADARVILFHESIDEVVALFELLVREGVPAVMEHSELPTELRETTLELFRAGSAQVVVSARSLIEGFNVPEADLGIIVASSSSSRQRIQSIGRVLRRHSDEHGEQKSSRICVLYMRDTVDETIYEKEDWGRLIGLDRNRYFRWTPPDEPIEESDPPRAAIPGESHIDFGKLRTGDRYPGRYDGEEFSTDRLGNVLDAESRIASNPQGIPETVFALRGSPGRFKVTPNVRALLVRKPSEAGEWSTLFAGILELPFSFEQLGTDAAIDPATLGAGDDYPGPTEPAEELRFRQRGGGTIAKRIRGGEAFARGGEAERLVEAIRQVSLGSRPLTKIFVNQRGHVFWREAGRARFVVALNGELEFPSLETS